MISQRRFVGFAVRRAGEVRRHLAAVLLAASLVVCVVWLIGLPTMKAVTSSLSTAPAPARSMTPAPSLGQPILKAFSVDHCEEVNPT